MKTVLSRCQRWCIFGQALKPLLYDRPVRLGRQAIESRLHELDASPAAFHDAVFDLQNRLCDTLRAQAMQLRSQASGSLRYANAAMRDNLASMLEQIHHAFAERNNKQPGELQGVMETPLHHALSTLYVLKTVIHELETTARYIAENLPIPFHFASVRDMTLFKCEVDTLLSKAALDELFLKAPISEDQTASDRQFLESFLELSVALQVTTFRYLEDPGASANLKSYSAHAEQVLNGAKRGEAAGPAIAAGFQPLDLNQRLKGVLANVQEVLEDTRPDADAKSRRRRLMGLSAHELGGQFMRAKLIHDKAKAQAAARPKQSALETSYQLDSLKH